MTLDFEDAFISVLYDEPRETALCVPSGNGAHYIVASQGEIRAVYAGPHGPENRPKRIEESTVKQLLEEADGAEVAPAVQTPLNDPAVVDLV